MFANMMQNNCATMSQTNRMTLKGNRMSNAFSWKYEIDRCKLCKLCKLYRITAMTLVLLLLNMLTRIINKNSVYSWLTVRRHRYIRLIWIMNCFLIEREFQNKKLNLETLVDTLNYVLNVCVCLCIYCVKYRSPELNMIKLMRCSIYTMNCVIVFIKPQN